MRRIYSVFVFGLLIWLGAGAPARGEFIRIEFSGLDLTYSGGVLYDSNSPLGGTGTPGQATGLVTMAFFRDDVLLGVRITDLFADVSIAMSGLSASGGMTTSSGGYFDLLTKSSTPGWGLGDVLGNTTFVYLNGVLTFFGSARVATILNQDLPFGLEIDPARDVQITFSTQLRNVTTSGGLITGFRALGTGELSAFAVPEPGSMALLGLGGLALAARLRTRRAAR